MRNPAEGKMYQKLEIGDIVIYLPEFYDEDSRHDKLYELVEVEGDLATIRATLDPSDEKTVPMDDLELSFSMNGEDEGMPW